MHTRWPTLASLAAALWLVAVGALAEISLDITADRSELFLGESVELQIKVGGTKQAANPDLSGIPDCKVVLGISGRHLNFDNGVRTEWTTFMAKVTPTRAGDVVMGPISVDADGRRLTATGPTLRVRGTEAQDWVYINVGASRDSVIADESFDVVVSIGMRALPAPYDQHDPLDARDPPHLTVPFLGTLAGLDAPPIESILQPCVVQRDDQPGFTLNNITLTVNPMMNFFNFGAMADRMQARFMFPQHTVDLPRGRYRVYDLRLTYVAKKEGSYTFGPVEFKGRPITDVGPGGQVRKRAILATGAAITVRVTSPPMQGRPPTFVGAVGSNLVVSATLDAQTCNVGDPLTLTLDISGDIGLDNLSPPILSRQPALTARFHIYDDTVRTVSRAGGRTYRYTLRPTQAGTYELPPIAVSYYDSAARAYRTAQSAPIPIRANESAQVGGGMILSAATNTITAMTFRGADSARIPAPITMDPAGAFPAPLLHGGVHGAIALLGPAALALTLVVRGTRRLALRRSQRIRPRSARRAAETALGHAAREPDPAQRGAAIRTALAAYLGNRLQAPMQGLTPADALRLLNAHPSIPAELAGRCHALYEQLFLAQFSPEGNRGADAATVEAAREIVRALDVALREPARTPRAGGDAMLLVLTLCLLAPPLGHAAPATDAPSRFMWDRANARMAAAQTPADFAEAAELYRELIRAGTRNGTLFYNEGVAALEAHQPAAALRAFLRAERYLGTRPELQQNIACALEATGADGVTSLLPTYRVILFWHYGLGFPVRLAFALGGFALLFLAAAMRLWNWRAAAQPVLALGAFLLIVFGTSIGASLHAESNDNAILYATPTTATTHAHPHK